MKKVLFIALMAVIMLPFNAYSLKLIINREPVQNSVQPETLQVFDEISEGEAEACAYNKFKQETYSEYPQQDYDKVFNSAVYMPSFPGGDAALMNFIKNNISYPQMAMINNIQGKVIVRFVVTKTGKVGEVKVVRSVDKELDLEAIRVCKMLPAFSPARNSTGDPVAVWYTLPISFTTGLEYQKSQPSGLEKKNIDPEQYKPNESFTTGLEYQKSQSGLEIEDELDYLEQYNHPKEYFRQVYQLAEKGDVHAVVRLGKLYDTGEGAVQKNTDEALVWYRKALAVDENVFLDNIGIEGDASRQIIEEYAKKGNLKAIMALGNYYYIVFDTKSGVLINGSIRIDQESGNKAIEYFKRAAKAGNAEAQQKLNNLYDAFKKYNDQQESYASSNRAYNRNYNDTMRNFAGVWTCRNSYTQFKFDIKGNGWFRNGSGMAWESLGVTYLEYNKIRVYDAHATHILKYSGGTFTQDNSYVYRKR